MSRVLMFGDTYLQKHLDCAQSLIPDLSKYDLEFLLTKARDLPRKAKVDALVYFNLPVTPPPPEYGSCPRILIDHGASNLKWFLANQLRFDFFDTIITAGPGHVASLLAFFADGSENDEKVRPGAFVKAKELLSPPRLSAQDLGDLGLDPNKPIVLFAPTWHLSAQPDIIAAGHAISRTPNHIATFHPETVHLEIPGLNVVENKSGITTELLKHASCLVSDTSSTIFEAAALNVPVVQLGLREYSDNNALMFDFPYVAGTSDLFLGGLYSRPEDVEIAVHRSLHPGPEEREYQALLFDRILTGTSITKVSSQTIVREINQSIVRGRRRTGEPSTATRARRKENLSRVHEDLSFARNRVIAHGGGDFRGHHASNSVESVKASTRVLNIVELDFVSGLDGCLVAHDTFESRYEFCDSFSRISRTEFLDARYEATLTPLSLDNAISLTAAIPTKALVCDVKTPKAEYPDVARQIFAAALAQDAVSRTVLQCYSVEDFRTALNIGFERVILPVWKYFYRDPTGEEAFNFLTSCMQINSRAVVGISMPWINKHMSSPIVDLAAFPRFQSFWKRVYIHGAPSQEYSRLMRRNLGIFADRIAPTIEFSAVPASFNWSQYLFLNPGLITSGIDNQISAIEHYIRWGSGEGRVTAFDAPPDFSYPVYLDLNPGLRQGGVGGSHSALAHWTRYGRHEGRNYRR